MKKRYFLLFVIMSTLLTSCSNKIVYEEKKTDPFERFNRNVFAFNQYLDKNIVKPISTSYADTVPINARKSIRNHLSWMNLPTTIVNSTLQMELENTILASTKFMLNGLTLGFYDLDEGETKVQQKDFGSTLASINIPEGPFLMVPFFGPKFTRDLTGVLIDRQNVSNASPDIIDEINLVEIPINIIDKREKLSKSIDNIYESPDPYIKMKSYYIQNRRNKVYGDKYLNTKNDELDAEFEKLLQ